MTISNIKVGADPEVFLYSVEDAKFVSSIGKFGGTKEKPLLIDPADPYTAVQEDNVAVEFNIIPSMTATQFRNNVKKGYIYIQQEATKYNCFVSGASGAYFSADELAHPSAQIFGCEPDYNAWTMSVNEKPCLPEYKKNFRSAGGHIHVSWDNPDLDVGIKMVKYMDAVLGLNSVLKDSGKDRKQLYGKAGAFRPKDYGIEYRVLSNFWIFSDILVEDTFIGVQIACDLLKGKALDHFINNPEVSELIVKAINDDDEQLAINLMDDMKIPEVYV